MSADMTGTCPSCGAEELRQWHENLSAVSVVGFHVFVWLKCRDCGWEAHASGVVPIKTDPRELTR